MIAITIILALAGLALVMAPLLRFGLHWIRLDGEFEDRGPYGFGWVIPGTLLVIATLVLSIEIQNIPKPDSPPKPAPLGSYRNPFVIDTIRVTAKREPFKDPAWFQD